MPGTSLYIVPTPIGNLGDITIRALEILKSVDLILGEDTRKSGVLLKHYGIKKPLKSYHNFNEHATVKKLVSRMQDGERFALISDAGSPLISDPGFLLVKESLAAELFIEALPGPTALIPALVKSGFQTDRFIFEGFIPVKKGRQSRLKQVAQNKITTILYESPHRLIKTLKQLNEICDSNRRISVSRELTKIHEETVTGTIEEVLNYFIPKPVKGEFVVVLEGMKDK